MTLPNLPEVQVVRHIRAKRMRLRVEPHAIRLTVPVFCTQKQIQSFLKQSQQWLEQTWHSQQQLQGTAELPETITFFDQTAPYTIIKEDQHKIFHFDHDAKYLYVRSEAPEAALNQAIFTYAKQALPIFLQHLSFEIGLNFRACHIRRPKTRWGSCSSQHDVMLHAGLVLMSQDVVRYVCIHELAHTRFFDHSPLFWQEVAKHESQYLALRRQLKTFKLPAWWLKSN